MGVTHAQGLQQTWGRKGADWCGRGLVIADRSVGGLRAKGGVVCGEAREIIGVVRGIDSLGGRRRSEERIPGWTAFCQICRSTL